MIDFEPKYITFDCYGTLTKFRMGDMARETYGDRLHGAELEQFVAFFSGYRRDEVLGAWKPYRDVIVNAVRDEIFGPVLTLQTFDAEDEALALAAHPDYGLAAGVHTADLGRALRMVRGIEAGTVWVNRYGRTSDFMIPTGGYKRSGLGKDLGRQAYEANLRFKSVLIDARV